MKTDFITTSLARDTIHRENKSSLSKEQDFVNYDYDSHTGKNRGIRKIIIPGSSKNCLDPVVKENLFVQPSELLFSRLSLRCSSVVPRIFPQLHPIWMGEH